MSQPIQKLSLIFALAFAVSLPALAQRVSTENGYNRKGSDYSTFGTRSLQECQRACEGDRRCQAYTYNHRQETCYLKDRAGSPSNDSTTTSGVREGGGYSPGRPVPGRPGEDVTETRGYDYKGSDYNQFPMRTLRDCQEECRRDRRCVAYTYSLQASICYLKDRVGDLKRDSDKVTGVKGDGLQTPDRPSPSFPGNTGGLSEEWGFDYKGGDYTNFRARDPRACKEECRRDSRCRGYTYATETNVCYLKDRIGDRERDGDKVTGLKDRYAEPGRPSSGGGGGRLSEEWGYDYHGGHYTDFKTRGMQECKDACRQDRRCEAYTYNNRTGVCYLKDQVGERRRDGDKVTGIKGGD